MDIFSIITLMGGLAFFLYGMHVLSTGLEKLAGGKLESALKRMTSNKFKSLILGAGITIAIQSSSAMTVMLVGLVNSGIMELSQTIGVIMGSNIGTTLTAWITSLAGIDSESVALNMLKPQNFAPIFALVGIGMIMLSGKKKRRDIGTVLVGFAILMSGMTFMTSATAGLSEIEGFKNILTAFENPLLGVLVGTVFTGIIQSSAASVGILQALAITGNISYGVAIPIIMGQNIGTCVTSLISSIGVNKNAKRVAVVHISFNVIGTAVCLALFYAANAVFRFPFVTDSLSPQGIALVHTIFNIVTTAMLLPFGKFLEKIANLVIKDSKHTKEVYSFLDDRLLNTPSIAISEANAMTVKMCGLATDTIISALSLFDNFAPDKMKTILANEDELDMYEDKLGTYLVKLSTKDISDRDSRQISKMLHTIGDFERIGDHAVNLLKTAQEMHDKKISFTSEAIKELNILTDAIEEILGITADAFTKNDIHIAERVEPLEQVIDLIITEIKANHIERLQSGTCTIQLGFVLSDLLTNYERVSDHCSNIAVAIIEVDHNSFETHEYLSSVKSMADDSFRGEFDSFNAKYSLKKVKSGE